MSSTLLVFESNMRNQDSIYESLQHKIEDKFCNFLMVIIIVIIYLLVFSWFFC